jgi:hypothetical protein
MKYNKKEYSVRDSFCKKLVNVCFIPFSGNGIYICRLYELGRCPDKSECIERLRIDKIQRIQRRERINEIKLPL